MVIGSHLPLPPSDTDWRISASVVFFRQYGALGVDLFFVLSGFLVSGLLFREFRARGRLHVGRFLVRRGLKIYPAFYAFLALTISLRLGYGDHLSRSQILSETFFVQNYVPGVWSHTWSLAVEEHFYLLLALLFVLLERRRKADPFRPLPWLFLLTTGIVLAARSWLISVRDYEVTTHRFPTHLEIDALFFGVILAYWWHKDENAPSLARTYRVPAVVAGVTVLTVSIVIRNPAASYVLGHALTYVGFGLIMLGAVSTPLAHSAIAAGTVRAIGYVGARSYSIYLWHTAVLVFGTILATHFLGRAPSFYETIVGETVGAVAVGIMMARLIELPVLIFRDRWFPSRVAPPTASVADPSVLGLPETP
jgi:peptidoglycan/LPS O-acetylase OafA/YrhL